MKITTVKQGKKLFYTDGEFLGKRVTQINGILDKPALMFWAANMTANSFAQQIRGLKRLPSEGYIETMVKIAKASRFKNSGEACDIGTTVHQLVEDYINGVKVVIENYDKPVQNGFNAFMSWWCDADIEVIATEEKVFYTHEDAMLGDISFGGTADLICKRNGLLTIGDWKTSKGFYEPSMALQLAAYLLAYEYLTDEKVEGGAFIGRLDKATGKFEEKTYSRELLTYYGRIFIQLHTIAEGLDYVKTLKIK